MVCEKIVMAVMIATWMPRSLSSVVNPGNIGWYKYLAKCDHG
jgi:hypothetical protein